MKSNYLFIFKNGKPFIINLIGAMILFFAVMRILHSPISSVVMAIASIGFFAFQSGIEINFKDKEYRNVSIFGPQMIGNWEPLPELEYVSLFKTNMVHSVTGRSGVSVSQKDTIVQVSLVGAQKSRIKVFEGKEMEEAVVKAKEFSKEFGLDIWDATIRPADWYVEH